MFLCERCDRPTDGAKKNKLCVQCYCEIMKKYTRDGKPVDTEYMNAIEEAEQFGELYSKRMGRKQ